MKSTNVIVIILLLSVAVTALLLSRPQDKTPQNPQVALEQIIQELETPQGLMKYQGMYSQLCASCHGENLEGNPSLQAPTLLKSEYLTDGGAIRVAQQIYQGGGKMPGFGSQIPRESIIALSLWILRQVQTANPSSSGPTPPMGESGQSDWSLAGTLELGTLALKYPKAAVFLFGKTRKDMGGPPLIAQKYSPHKTISFTLGPQNTIMGRPLPAGSTLYLQARIDLDGNVMTKDGEPVTKVLELQLNGDIKDLKLKFKNL